jgi:Ion channel
MIRDELRRLMHWEERHKRLLSRLVLLVIATLIIDAAGTIANYYLERHAQQTEIKSVFDAFFYTSVQLLTVSSSLKNPISSGGRIVDIFLELWGVLAIAGSAGAMASFFQSGDR